MYKVGDNVKIRSNLIPERKYGSLHLWEGMQEPLVGKTVKILEVCKEQKTYWCDAGYYISEEMIAKPAKKKYTKGRRITSLDDLYQQDFIMWHGKVYHKGWTHAWQIQMAVNAIYSETGMWVAVRTEAK